ncbi:hypothetical protein [Anaerolinea thermolimosa]|nr:hypothetical protein [Anaerolinea thermolimosa]
MVRFLSLRVGGGKRMEHNGKRGAGSAFPPGVPEGLYANGRVNGA